MRRVIREDDSAVASTVATMFSLLVVLSFLYLTMVAVVPRQQYEAEFATSEGAIEAFGRLRSLAAGPFARGAQFSVPVSLGTPAVSLFSGTSPGTLTFQETATSSVTASVRFVPNFNQGRVAKVDQDVILLMDSSGSMGWNDPQRLRIEGAKEYVGQLKYPDRIAIVDFDEDAVFTRVNVGGPPHLLGNAGHNGVPDYSDPQADLDTIDQSGSTNFGDAIRIANDEFITHGDGWHVWVMILLTDGENNFAWQDDLARSEAGRAKANGIVIYTIGLGGEPDEALLTEVAETTGGTYYAAPDAASIRLIYFEISRRYQGSFACGLFAADEATFGSLTLSLATREYPAQSLVLEGSSFALRQANGAVIRDGFPLQFEPTRHGAGVLTMKLVTFTGNAFATSGIETVFIQAKALARDFQVQQVVKPLLDEEAAGIENISVNLQSWADQGAATQAAADSVQVYLDQAEESALRAFDKASMGRNSEAKFDVDRAHAELSAAIDVTRSEADEGDIQAWLAETIEGDILVAGCRLDQWRNWYDGVSIDLRSDMAGAWANWLSVHVGALGADFSIGQSGDRVVVSIRAIDRFELDRRVIALSFA